MEEVFTTYNGADYKFFKTLGTSFNFQVSAPNDAHIILSNAPEDDAPCYEIFIGGWKNTQSAIRLNKNPDRKNVCEKKTPDILSGSEFRSFWICWDFEGIHCGFRRNKNLVIMEWPFPPSITISYFGVRTCWGASGSWILDRMWPHNNPVVSPFVDQSISAATFWLPMKPGENVPKDAVKGGFDGEDTYVGRAKVKDALQIGTVVPSLSSCFVPYMGLVYSVKDYEILVCSSGKWVPADEKNKELSQKNGVSNRPAPVSSESEGYIVSRQLEPKSPMIIL